MIQSENFVEQKCNRKVLGNPAKKRFTHLVLQKKKWFKNYHNKIQSPMFLITIDYPLKLLAKQHKTLWFLMKKMINLIFQISLRVRLTFVILVRIEIRFKVIWILEPVVWRIKQVKNNQLRNNQNLKKGKLKMETLKGIRMTLEYVASLEPVLFFEDIDFHLVYK